MDIKILDFKPGEGCRNCPYIFYFHKQHKLSDFWYDVGNSRYICKCKNFEPVDNLKYLEMKYDKSQFRTKTIC